MRKFGWFLVWMQIGLSFLSGSSLSYGTAMMLKQQYQLGLLALALFAFFAWAGDQVPRLTVRFLGFPDWSQSSKRWFVVFIAFALVLSGAAGFWVGMATGFGA